MRRPVLATVLTLTLAAATTATTAVTPAPASAAAPAVTVRSAAATTVPSSVKAQFDRRYGTFRTFYRSGSGTATIPLPAGARSGLLSVTASHADTGFEIQELTASGSDVDNPVFVTGPYTGRTAYGTDSWRRPTALRVRATGHWTIGFRPVSSAPPLTASGHGDAVSLYWGAATSRRFVSKGGHLACLVRETPLALDTETVLASSHGAECNATAHFRKGPSVVQVNSGGDWTLR